MFLNKFKIDKRGVCPLETLQRGIKIILNNSDSKINSYTV